MNQIIEELKFQMFEAVKDHLDLERAELYREIREHHTRNGR